jgi:hypothetical protein
LKVYYSPTLSFKFAVERYGREWLFTRESCEVTKNDKNQQYTTAGRRKTQNKKTLEKVDKILKKLTCWETGR